jgi:hypothetical protein
VAAGAITGRIGAPATIECGGILCIAGAVWFAMRLPRIRSEIRPIYRNLGILPKAAPPLPET